MTESTKLIVDRLGNEGYAFANVNPVPEIDREKKLVAFTLYVDPGRRVYVRRINISGNTTTRDEVIRREMRQLEGGWYSADKLKRSKVRIDKLGYFSEVSVDTVNVPGAPDEVDVEVKVVERPTGNLLFGIGYSTAEKVILSASISQANLFGTGNALSLQVNSGSVNKVYALSFTNPYFTDDGVSLGADLYKRNVDAVNLNSVTPYTTKTLGTGVRLGVPITEYDTINYGLAVERTDVQTFIGSPPAVCRVRGRVRKQQYGLDRDGRLVARRSRQHDLHDQRYAPTPELRSCGAAGGAALLSHHVSDRPLDSNGAGVHFAAQRSDRVCARL